MKDKNIMSQTRTIALLSTLLIGICAADAREHLAERSGANSKANGTLKAAGCSPSTATDELDLNNVRALLETGGNMWEDRAAGNPAYEVPKTEDRSGPNALFAGSLWMGGFSPDNQLKLAAVRFRQVGNDFWPGPLTNTGDASIPSEVCIQYDRTWKTYFSDAEKQAAFFACDADPDCDAGEEFPDYIIPAYFYEWPALGDVSMGQDFYLAPFGDLDGDGDYNPENGDYPGYDLDGVVDCKNKFREDPVPLFGDQNIWWVFNDKGNAHTESGGQPIGMEIRAQAFAFSTNDEVNNMTFYNYVVINQGTQTLQNTYFGQWVDADLGNFQDDYVGCDVGRGLGYAYNGDNNDESGDNPGYGVQPPAIGVDFFEGPFQDYDGFDNPLTTNIQHAIDSAGIPYKGIGIGYGDGVADNERYGMRAFLYHNNDNTVRGDPDIAIEYYNYLRAIWRDNSPNLYGGTGHQSDPDADPNTPAFYMFPGDTDPLGWGTGGSVQGDLWTEETAGNFPDDRRFIQSAGPFTLEPGAYNNVTVGVVWARATSGGPFASVGKVQEADDKAQSLFDNCFRILNGPDAPNLDIQELDREVVLYITNPLGSNNFNEEYIELDATIPETATDDNGNEYNPDRFYRFQGYQIYQLANSTVSVSELNDVSKARLVFQCDVEDGVTQLVNYVNDPNIGLPVPMELVNGADEGIVHALSITEDKFSDGNPRLINFKTYYFMAVAYGYNEWAEYNPVSREGQPFPYLRGRKSATGEISFTAAIPHKPAPEAGGTDQLAGFGDGFDVTRVEGAGNGGLEIELAQSTIDAIMSSPDHRVDELRYTPGKAPINVKVVDPLMVPTADFELWFQDSITLGDLNDAYWYLKNVNTGEIVNSTRTITVGNEQLILDWGMSVSIADYVFPSNGFTEPLGGFAEFADINKAWYSGIPDQEGENMLNWIRSGTSSEDANSYNDYVGKDDEELWETNTGGTWAPWPLCGDTAMQPVAPIVLNTTNIARLDQVTSIQVVITPDKNKWTRSPVFEIAEFSSEHGDPKLGLRSDQSVDKNGNPDGSGTGMGWFPGYAIELETGERLNIGFGEDSFWGGPSGRDMIWNPSDTLFAGPLAQPIMGGGHWIYVFKNERRTEANDTRMPQYDEGEYIRTRLASGSSSDRTRVWRAVNWVGSALKIPGSELLATEVRIRLNVARPYEAYTYPYAGYTPEFSTPLNNGINLYKFSTAGTATLTNVQSIAEEALDIINVVPNPYYAFSSYETGRLDNRIKFINLPQTCTISIYNVSGTLVRKFRKDNDLTFLDWDLKNSNNVPIAGGVYICHIDVPGVGEKVLKWFGVIRPPDLQNF